MSETETLQYFARIAAKLERISDELASSRSPNRETVRHLHRLADAIRKDLPGLMNKARGDSSPRA